MRKKRIGFVVNNLVVGGVSKVLIELCNSLANEGYDIHLLILSNDLQMTRAFPIQENVQVHLFDYAFSRDYGLLTYLKNSFFLKGTYDKAQSVLKKIRELELDILHFHTLPRQLGIGILARQEQPGLQLVFTDHVMRISPKDYKWHQEQLLAFAYRNLYREFHLIAVSKAVYEYILRYRLNSPVKELQLLENSIQLSGYNPQAKEHSSNKLQFIYISRMSEEKGHFTLIKAWKQLKDREKYQLLLVGPDETDGKLKEFAGDDSSIVFTGSVSNVKPYLQEASIAVFPSKREGLPLALLEMMAYKLAIIVSDIPELTSVIDNEKEGLHFPVNNVDALQQKMELLINSPELRTRLGMEARKKVEMICKANDPIAFHERFYRGLSS
jgi:glycosyltransferase involved in cell wall biosynthesis